MAKPKRKKHVHVEIQIIPYGGWIERDLKPVFKLIEASGFSKSTSCTGAILEGEWKDVIGLVEQCHNILIALPSVLYITTRIQMKVSKS